MNGNKTFRSSNRFQQPYYYIVANLDLSRAVSGGIFYFNKDNNLSYLDQRNYDKFYIIDKNVIVNDVVVYTNPDFSLTRTSLYGPVFLIGGAQNTLSETVLPFAAPSGYGPKTAPQFSGAPLNFIQLNQGSVNIFGHTGAKFPYGVNNLGLPDPRTDLKYLSVSVLSTPPSQYSLVVNNTNNTLVNYIEPFYGDSLFNVTPVNNTLITYIDPVPFALIINNTNDKLSVFIDPVEYLPISEYTEGTTIQINDITNTLVYTINVPIGNYSFADLATVVSGLFTDISAPVSMSWDPIFGKYSFTSSGPVISVSWFSGVEEQFTYGFTGLEPDSSGTIQATNSPLYQPSMILVDSSNAQITVQDNLLNIYTVTVPFGWYLPIEYANIVNTLYNNAGIPIQMRYNSSPFVFEFISGVFQIDITPLSVATKLLLGFDGTEPIGFSVVANNAADISSQIAITVSFNNIVALYDVTTATSYSVFVPTGRYTATAYANQVTNLFAAIPGCPITMTWNGGLSRFEFSGGLDTISVSPFTGSVPAILGFTGLEPDATIIIATNAPNFYTFSGTNVNYTLTVPSGEYSTTTIATELQTQFLNNNITMDVSFVPSLFTFTKQIVPVIGDTGLFQFINTIPNPTTITAKIGNLIFGVSATSQSTTTAPIYDPFPESNIYVILNVPTGLYTADGLAAVLTQLYENYSPSINITVDYSYSLQRFIFTKQPLAIGDLGNFQFVLNYLTNTTTINTLIGTLPFAVSANPQQTSTSPPPISVPVVGTGFYTTVVVPNGTYTEYELSQILTNLYYNQGIPITVVYDAEINRFEFIKSSVVPGDPALFKYVLTDGMNTTTANILTGLDVVPPPPIIASNPVVANYAPNTPQ